MSSTENITILCDTCVVLMLIRIAPDMFIDSKYGCVTVHSVHDEIKRSSRFKTRYPWRDKYLPKIKPKIREASYIENKAIIEYTKDAYGLSKNDSIFALTAFEQQLRMATHDQDRSNNYRSSLGGLVKCCQDEYDLEVVSALDIVNEWIENQILTVDKQLIDILKDWEEMREAPMPQNAKKKFTQLTGIKFPIVD